MFADAILILAPHPDDEVVGCAAAIGRARQKGAALSVLFLTDGIPAAPSLWPWDRAGRPARVACRRREAGEAAEALGIDIVGFAGRPSRTLRLDLDNARAEIAAAIRSTAAGMLWVPAFEGAHQDHDAANLLAASFAPDLPVWEFAEYAFLQGRPVSNRFADETGATVLELSAAERDAKAACLRLYRSERGNLGHIASMREALRPLQGHGHGCAHDTRPFWARFQWVPFRHPRVDFTPPERVAADLAAWRDRNGLERPDRNGRG